MPLRVFHFDVNSVPCSTVQRVAGETLACIDKLCTTAHNHHVQSFTAPMRGFACSVLPLTTTFFTTTMHHHHHRHHHNHCHHDNDVLLNMQQLAHQTDMMSDPRFVAAFSHLAPAVIRVGGITADWAYYEGFHAEPATSDHSRHPSRLVGRDEADMARSKRTTDDTTALINSTRSTARVRTRGYWPTSEFNLTFATFMQLHDFAAASGLSLMFDLNELHGECATLFIHIWHMPCFTLRARINIEPFICLIINVSLSTSDFTMTACSSFIIHTASCSLTVGPSALDVYTCLACCVVQALTPILIRSLNRSQLPIAEARVPDQPGMPGMVQGQVGHVQRQGFLAAAA